MGDGRIGTLTIERAVVTDAAEILVLQRLAFQSEAQRYQEPTLPPLRQTLAELVTDFGTHLILKASIEDCIVGSVRASADGSTCSIGRLMVHPQLQGIGSALMCQLEAHFPDARQFRLSTGARSVANIRLYTRLGYTIVAIEPITDRVSVVIMTKMPQPTYPDNNHGAQSVSNQSSYGAGPS